jgi:trehalose synthase
MPSVTQVPIAPWPPDRFRELLGERYREVEEGIVRARELFRGRVIWHVNSTSRGGGVVELLTSLLAYARGAGVDTRWAVIEGSPEFFAITKRIHNNLHGFAGDGGDLGAAEREIYDSVLSRNAAELAALVRPQDIVFLHDPQTAGLVDAIRDTGAKVVWRCHVGLDLPNDIARGAWRFLRPFVDDADAYVFSRREFAWEGLEGRKTWVVAPSIDAFSPKNQEMDPETVAGVLRTAGLTDDRGGPANFVREDGTPGRVDRAAELHQDGPVPGGAAVVAQVSRWDRLKDPIGVLRGFVEHVSDPRARLLLAGPAVAAVTDDPEGAEVLAEVIEQRDELPPETRARVHLACLPMDDVEENAAIVNAIQRRADVVVQKSIAEGFGLTVAEAMWKARPVVASRRGGIQDQIVDRESGLLVDDPTDLDAFGAAIAELLDDRQLAQRIGVAAQERVREHFLGTRQLIQYLQLLGGLVGGKGESAPLESLSR